MQDLQAKRIRARIYIGHNLRDGKKPEIFRSVSTPTKETTPQYRAVVGPFRTITGARYMRDNPMIETVADAERWSKYTSVETYPRPSR